MDSQQLPGQAPQVNPNPQNPNQPPTPYDFIINPAQPPKKSPITSSSLPMRLLIIVGGLFIVVILVAVILSALGGGGKSGLNENSALSLAQDQTQLLHLTSTGDDAAVGQGVKNFSINVTLSVKSQQAALQTFAASKGIKLNSKLLATKHDSATDTRLTNAKSSSTFDSAYKDVMETALTTYRQDLSSAYKGADMAGQTLLKSDYDATQLLLTQLQQTN